MSELVALLILGLLALAYHLTHDEPWTVIERRANQAIAALAEIGKMVERVLACGPVVDEGARYLILGKDAWDDKRTLGSELGKFDPSWCVEQMRGYVTLNRFTEDDKAAHRQFYGMEPEPAPQYTAKAYYILRGPNGEWDARKAGLAGDDLEVLLGTFAGCFFSQGEVDHLESVWKNTRRFVTTDEQTDAQHPVFFKCTPEVKRMNKQFNPLGGGGG